MIKNMLLFFLVLFVFSSHVVGAQTAPSQRDVSFEHQHNTDEQITPDGITERNKSIGYPYIILAISMTRFFGIHNSSFAYYKVGLNLNKQYNLIIDIIYSIYGYR